MKKGMSKNKIYSTK